MVAYIRKMVVEKKRWLDAETFSDHVAPCQMTPGATAMQTAVYGGVQCSFVCLLLIVTIRFALNVQWDLLHLLVAISALVDLRLKVDILWSIVIGTIILVRMFIPSM
jgi:chromate transport protein ChrA